MQGYNYTVKPRPGTPISTAPLATGLVGYLPLNEGAGQKALDVVAGFYNARFRGNLSWTGTPWGGGLKFSGTAPCCLLLDGTALSGVVTNATNASPIVITSAAHGLLTGRQVIVNGVGGNTNANNTWTVTVVNADTFSLDTSTGNAAYTSAGAWCTTVPTPNRTIANGSLSVRFKVSSIAADVYIASRVKSGSTNDGECRLFINNANSNKLRFGIENSSATVVNIDSDAALVVDTWYHVVCTWSNGVTNSQKMYINGVLQASVGTPPAPVGPTDMPWALGRNNALNTLYLTGTIDSFALWNRPLSAADVKQLYNTPNALFAAPSWKRYYTTAAANVSMSPSASISASISGSLSNSPSSDPALSPSLSPSGSVSGSFSGSISRSMSGSISQSPSISTGIGDYRAKVSAGNIANTTERIEISGICRSNYDSTLLWGINDSGGLAEIYAIGTDGSDRGAWALSGASNVDWEDIASATVSSNHYIYVGEIGDNASAHSTGKIYRVLEPTPTVNGDGTISAGNIETITFQYPDTPAGETYGGTPARRDAETLIVNPLNGDMYIISKRETVPRIFKLAHASSYSGTQTLTYVGDMSADIPEPVGGVVPGRLTGGDCSPDGLEVVVCTYNQIFRVRRPNTSTTFENMLMGPVELIDTGLLGSGAGQLTQLEGVAFDYNNTGFYALSEKNATNPLPLWYYARIMGYSASPSGSVSFSPSISRSVSGSISRSISGSISASPSPSNSPSPSHSGFIESRSASNSPSPSYSPSPSISPSPSRSISGSISLSPSISRSLSGSVSLSPSISSSTSPSSSISASPSEDISGPLPSAPTLSINAAGDTATIAGSDFGSSNAVLVATLTSGSLSFSSAGSRTGDGTVSLSLTPGYGYVAYVSSTLGGTSYSNTVYFFIQSGGAIAVASRAVLEAVQQKLIDDGIFTASTVFITLNPELQPMNPPSTMFCMLTPGSRDVDQRQVAGGGRDNHATGWTFDVIVCSALALDQGDRDNAFLTHSSLGVLDKLDEVVDCLQLYDPVDVDNNRILIEPMRQKSGSSGRKLSGKVGAMGITMEAKYVLNLPTANAIF